MPARQPYVKWLLSVAIALSFTAVCNSLRRTDSYDRCDYYNQQLNGGTHFIQGTAYKIHLCGNGGNSMGAYDRVRMQIMDANDQIIGIRYFIVNWNEGAQYPLQYGDNFVAYVDQGEYFSEFNNRISLPPTLWDRLSAKFR